MDVAELGASMRAIRGYAGGFETQCALMIGILTFVRPGELRKAEWAKFDLDQGEWCPVDAYAARRERGFRGRGGSPCAPVAAAPTTRI